MRILVAFVLFLLASQGKPRLEAWRALRRECLKRVDQKKPKKVVQLRDAANG